MAALKRFGFIANLIYFVESSSLQRICIRRPRHVSILSRIRLFPVRDSPYSACSPEWNFDVFLKNVLSRQDRRSPSSELSFLFSSSESRRSFSSDPQFLFLRNALLNNPSLSYSLSFLPKNHPAFSSKLLFLLCVITHFTLQNKLVANHDLSVIVAFPYF